MMWSVVILSPTLSIAFALISLGSGSVFGYKFIEGDGMIAFVLAPGAFLVLGYLMVLFNKATARLR